MSLLFWLRRFRVMRINVVISEEYIEKIYQRAKEFVKSKAYPFKNLVHIFYNASYLNRNVEDIVLEIIKQMRNPENAITPALAHEILQACAKPDKFLVPKEYLLIDQVQKILPSILKDTDNDQKSSFFKYLAALEMHLNPPRYRVPSTLYILKNQLKENLEQLQEEDVILIIEAYKDLPKEFHQDLLDEVKSMFYVTIQHQSSQIKSFFLLDFLDKITQVPAYRKLTEERFRLIFDEVGKRLPEDQFLSKFKNIEKIIEVYDRAGIKHPQLVEKVYEAVLKFPDSFFSGPVLQCFSNHKLDIKPLLDKYIESSYFAKQADLQALRLFIVLTGLKEEKYNSVKDNLKKQFLSNTADLHKFVSLIANSSVENEEITELLQTMIESFRSSREKINDYAFYKAMIHSVISNDLKKNWQRWAKENLNDLGINQLQRLTDVVFSFNGLTVKQFQIYSYILNINKPENIPLKKLLSGLKDSKALLFELSKVETSLENFLEKLLSYMEVRKSDVRISTVFGLVKRIEATGLIIPVTTTLLRNAYKISKDLNIVNNFTTEIMVTLHLLENGALRKEDAKEFYEKCKRKLFLPLLLIINRKFK